MKKKYLDLVLYIPLYEQIYIVLLHFGYFGGNRSKLNREELINMILMKKDVGMISMEGGKFET